MVPSDIAAFLSTAVLLIKVGTIAVPSIMLAAGTLRAYLAWR